LNPPFILQIVGYKNSGKTAFITQLTQKLVSSNKSVIVLKHHGHSEDWMGQDQSTDTGKFLASGALGACVTSGPNFLMEYRGKVTPTLEKQILAATFWEPDVILIEGYKMESYPKVVLLRNEDDTVIPNLKNMIAIVGTQSVEQVEHQAEFFVETSETLEWVIKRVLNGNR
jgi:molybdopterin-guanine dinucleotide biosynthesis protein B